MEDYKKLVGTNDFNLILLGRISSTSICCIALQKKLWYDHFGCTLRLLYGNYQQEEFKARLDYYKASSVRPFVCHSAWLIEVSSSCNKVVGLESSILNKRIFDSLIVEMSHSHSKRIRFIPKFSQMRVSQKGTFFFMSKTEKPPQLLLRRPLTF